MIYISRIDLDPRSRRVHAELRNPYEMHRSLSRAFGQRAEPTPETRCLFRVDEESAGSQARVLVQSRERPDWSWLEKVSTSYVSGPPQVKEVAAAFREAQRLRFRLRANPTTRKAGKRTGLYREEEHLAWLERKATAGGFLLRSAAVSPAERLQFRTTAGYDARMCAVQFDGVLQVKDPAIFLETLESGIGSGKAFGFGLLSLARA